MAYESNYDWGTARRSTYRVDTENAKFRWWIVVAVLLSIVAHVFLIYWFGYLKLDSTWAADKEMLKAPPERFAINPELLKEKIAIQELPENVPPPDIETFKANIDEFDIQELLPEEKITFTPATEEIANLIRDPAPAVQKGTDMTALDVLDTPAAEDFATELAKMKKEILATPSSDHQKLIDYAELDLGDSGPDEGLLDDFLDPETRGKLDGAEIKGFSDLDDLLGHGGVVTSSTDPILMPTDLLFAFGKSELAESARLSMMKLGILIQRNPNSTFVIEGHTDSIGTDSSNQRLSIERAQSVKNWLVESLRLDPARIKVIGHGESKTIIDPDGSREAQSLNRRVEITVEPK